MPRENGTFELAPQWLRALKGVIAIADIGGDMTTIRTTCPRCGEVDMGPESILLSVQGDGREGTYKFTCPTCADDVEKRADRKIVALLVSAGVGVAGSEGGELGEYAPEGLFDDEEEEDLIDPRGLLPEGPAFSADDIIDFHFLLADETYIEEFFATH